MSEILIKGLTIKDYPQTITINPDGSVIKDTFGLHRLVEEWKAIEVPTHGDLIDKQAVVKQLSKAWAVECDSDFANKSVWRIVEKEVQTVIEASTEERE